MPPTDATDMDTALMTPNEPQPTSVNNPSTTVAVNKKKLSALSTMEQAKDRAQITAATAMSIVHVALLKDVLDAGPVGNKYYYWSLGFIIAALILQIISGFVAIYIAILRFYYTEYKDDFLRDCYKACCPVRCERLPQVTGTVANWIKGPHTASTNLSNLHIDEGHTTDEHTGLENIEIHSSSNKKTGCCGEWSCTTRRHPVHEYHIIALHDLMAEEIVRSDLQTANIETELSMLANKCDRLNSEIEKHDKSETPESKDYVKQLKKQLAEAQNLREDAENRKICATKLRAQEMVLEKHVSAIYEERVLKRATFWQNLLNMALYTVFILNAVIAGIGLATVNVTVGEPGALSQSNSSLAA